jgi:uncharacterized protein
VLSIPSWLVGAVVGRQALPGLPVVDALIVVCPLLAASILVYGESGSAGVKELLKRASDYERVRTKVWYTPVLLLMPAASFAAYGLMRVTGLQLPTPHVPVLAAPAMFLAFFVGAVSEEVGWSGYATDAMQARWSALEAGILLGLVWAAWHIIQLVQVGRSPAWIAWWSLRTVSARVLIVWLYNNTGKSVFAAALFHAMMNVSWQLFPNHGSHWDPRINGLIVACVATTVTIAWGPRTLARHRNARRDRPPVATVGDEPTNESQGS